MRGDVTATTRKSNVAIACEVGGAITASLVLEEVLVDVAQRIAEAVDVWECDLHEYYPESGALVCAACWSREMTQADRDWVGQVLSLDDQPSYRPVLEELETTEDYIDGQDVSPQDRKLMEAWGEKSILTVPLVLEGQAIGSLTLVEKRRVRRFSEADKQLVHMLSGPAALAIQNARMYRRQEEQNRQLASLLDSTRAIASSVVLEDALDIVGRTAAQALGSPQSVIYEYDKQQDAFIYRSVYDSLATGDYSGNIGSVYPLDHYPDDRTIIENDVIVEDTISDAALRPSTRASMEEFDEKTCLNVPLRVGGEPVGELVIIEVQQERHFTDEERVLARALGEQAAVAIQHAKLYRRQQEQNRRLVALLETSRALAAALDTRALLTRVRDEVATLLSLPSEAVDVCLRDGDGGYVSLAALAAGEEDLGESPADGISSAAAADEVVRRAFEGLCPARGDGEAGGARVVVPFVLKNVVEGYADIAADHDRPIGDDEVELVQILAGQAAAAIDNARLYHQIELQAIKDGLTGLYNHRYFYERLFQEFARAQRYGVPLSLLMLDIDDFKQFNDEFGHQVGDQVLGEVAAILSSQLRIGVDIAARYGGEEFVVLLPNTPRGGAEVVGGRLKREVELIVAAAPESGERVAEAPPRQSEGAALVGERIRHTIEVAPLSAPDGRVTAHVTVSIGLATFPEAAGSPDELVGNADKAMYLAKRLGKNRLEVFSY
jgi:diguanylate cyclase (GGDEF)-like protein